MWTPPRVSLQEWPADARDNISFSGMPTALSSRLLWLLIGLAMKRETMITTCQELGGDQHGELVREAVIMGHLVAAAQSKGAAARRLDLVLANQLRSEAARYRGYSLSDMTALWAQERHLLGGKPLAAFLWTVMRHDGAVFGNLAERLADDIEVLAIRALRARQDPGHPDPML